MDNFVERLRVARKLRKMSQTDLADAIHVHATSIGLWERGVKVPNLDNAVSICIALGISLDFLTGLSNRIELVDQNRDNALSAAYFSLDSYGRKVVDAVICIETQRLQNATDINKIS